MLATVKQGLLIRLADHAVDGSVARQGLLNVESPHDQYRTWPVQEFDRSRPEFAACQYFVSKTGVMARQELSSVDIKMPLKGQRHQVLNPSCLSSYVIKKQKRASVFTDAQIWRRRELHPRPETHPSGRLRVCPVIWFSSDSPQQAGF